MVSYALVAELGGKLSRQFFLPPPAMHKLKYGCLFHLFQTIRMERFINYNQNLIQIVLFSWLHRFISLVAGVRDKLFRAVFLAPTCITKTLDAHSTDFKPPEC